MNKTTVEIAEYVATIFAPCDLKTAARIREVIASDLDFSSCSKRELFTAVIKTVLRTADHFGLAIEFVK